VFSLRFLSLLSLFFQTKTCTGLKHSQTGVDQPPKKILVLVTEQARRRVIVYKPGDAYQNSICKDIWMKVPPSLTSGGTRAERRVIKCHANKSEDLSLRKRKSYQVRTLWLCSSASTQMVSASTQMVSSRTLEMSWGYTTTTLQVAKRFKTQKASRIGAMADS
jgi:hypothetical protein